MAAQTIHWMRVCCRAVVIGVRSTLHHPPKHSGCILSAQHGAPATGDENIPTYDRAVLPPCSVGNKPQKTTLFVPSKSRSNSPFFLLWILWRRPWRNPSSSLQCGIVVDFFKQIYFENPFCAVKTDLA